MGLDGARPVRPDSKHDGGIDSRDSKEPMQHRGAAPALRMNTRDPRHEKSVKGIHDRIRPFLTLAA